MNDSNGNKQLQDLWHDRVQRCEKRPGTIQVFCEAEGVSPAALGYWQAKFSSSKTKARTSVTSARPQMPVPHVRKASTPFAEVEVRRSFADAYKNPDRAFISQLPDAKWAAEFVRHLFVGREGEGTL